MIETINTKIIAVAGNKKVLKTVEDEANWWFLTPEVTKFLEAGANGVKAGATADLEIDKTFADDGKEKVTISRITVIKEDKPKPEYKESSYASAQDEKTISIVRQSTLKCACILMSGQEINNAEVAQEAVVALAKRLYKYVETGE